MPAMRNAGQPPRCLEMPRVMMIFARTLLSPSFSRAVPPDRRSGWAAAGYEAFHTPDATEGLGQAPVRFPGGYDHPTKLAEQITQLHHWPPTRIA
jgi:hypothetical protein